MQGRYDVWNGSGIIDYQISYQIQSNAAKYRTNYARNQPEESSKK